ncbi:alpha/beta hydrolase [Sinomonas sp. ASV322]|uniref:alpha/beta hydrolase n=1 Tax=Sinomonas sp. ASV322 TaxID=3041920 RepID=UPI0027DE052E|nr:alpha/beta hydrolase [Sinomonas sp. ASV322]MDQ4503856.1 alpha/beta hydrolase [Sinomonas sp. ASV322]
MTTPAPSQGPALPAAGTARPRTLVVVLVCLAALTLTLTGCLPLLAPPSTSGPSTEASATAGAPPELARFYQQQIQWSPCETESGRSQFECTQVMVPIDYAKPDGDTIKLAVIRLKNSKAKSNLFVNPGGPGVSGYDLVRDAGTTMFTEKLRGTYNLIGWDPRGVKRSAPVTCLDAAKQDALRQESPDESTDAGLAEAFALQDKVIDACKANTGPILAHTDTLSSVKDMDILRAVASGRSKLDYAGFSYGTQLGSVYAGLFPDRVGRFALDGALDPSLDNREITLGQAKAFEDELHAYLRSCLAKSGCPFKGSEDDAIGQVQSLAQSVQNQPLRNNDGRLLPIADFINGLVYALYSDQSWPALTQAFAAALRGDGSGMMRISDFAADRVQDGTYSSNGSFAFLAYNCLDYSMASDTASMRAEADELKRAAPTLGEFFAYGGVTCRDWPYKPVDADPKPARYTGSSPILVVGTTGDPATPYPWAQALRSQLGNASLLTWNAQGHTAYGRGSACIDDAFDGYLVDGKLPQDGKRC